MKFFALGVPVGGVLTPLAVLNLDGCHVWPVIKSLSDPCPTQDRSMKTILAPGFANICMAFGSLLVMSNVLQGTLLTCHSSLPNQCCSATGEVSGPVGAGWPIPNNELRRAFTRVPGSLLPFTQLPTLSHKLKRPYSCAAMTECHAWMFRNAAVKAYGAQSTTFTRQSVQVSRITAVQPLSGRLLGSGHRSFGAWNLGCYCRDLRPLVFLALSSLEFYQLQAL